MQYLTYPILQMKFHMKTKHTFVSCVSSMSSFFSIRNNRVEVEVRKLISVL